MTADLQLTISNLWILIATAMVFIMHLGFAALEAGFTRSKNTVNILFKNIGVISIGLLSFAVVGYSLMYPGEAFGGGFFGFLGLGCHTQQRMSLLAPVRIILFIRTLRLFQAMFAYRTPRAATIAGSGAIAQPLLRNDDGSIGLLNFCIGVGWCIVGTIAQSAMGGRG